MTTLVTDQSALASYPSNILADFLAGFERLVNQWAAAAIAHHESRAALVALRQMQTADVSATPARTSQPGRF